MSVPHPTWMYLYTVQSHPIPSYTIIAYGAKSVFGVLLTNGPTTTQDCEDFFPSERFHVEGGIEECMEICQVTNFIRIYINIKMPPRLKFLIAIMEEITHRNNWKFGEMIF